MSSVPNHRSVLLAWLLLVLLASLAVHPPRCEFCDTFPLAPALSQPVIYQHRAAPAETCNGLCCCCALIALLPLSADPQLLGAVSALSLQEPPSPALSRRASIFRPPRPGFFA